MGAFSELLLCKMDQDELGCIAGEPILSQYGTQNHWLAVGGAIFSGVNSRFPLSSFSVKISEALHP